MTRRLRSLCATLILTAILGAAGCARPASPPGPLQTEPGPSGPSVQGEPPDSPAAADPGSVNIPTPPQGATEAPPLESPCTPGASAVDLSQKLPGSGVVSRRPTQEPTAEHPWFLYLSASQIWSYSGASGILGDIYVVRSGSAVVGLEELVLRAQFQRAPSEEWYRAHLKLTGIEPLSSNLSAMGAEFRLPAGKAGDGFRLTVDGVIFSGAGGGDLDVQFCRQAPPKEVTLSYLDKGQWRALSPDGYMPELNPVEVRIGFPVPMDRETVEIALGQLTVSSQITRQTWADNRTLELVIADPGRQYPIRLFGSRTTLGQYLETKLHNLYPGEPAHAVAVDPATGQTSRLAELPPRVDEPELSPDGTQLRFMATEEVAMNHPLGSHWIVDLGSGERSQVPPEGFFQWLSDGTRAQLRWEKGILTLTRFQVDTGTGTGTTVQFDEFPRLDSYQLSPDGKYLLVLVPEENPTDVYPNLSVRPVIVGTSSAKRQNADRTILVNRPGKDGLSLYGPAFSPDGAQIALTTEEAGKPAVLLIDSATGQTRTLARGVPGVRGNNFDRILFAPDGRFLLAGEALLDLKSGELVRRVAGVVGREPFSPRGDWLMLRKADDPKVYALNLQTGQETRLGEGDPVGWRSDGQAVLIQGARPFQWLQYNK